MSATLAISELPGIAAVPENLPESRIGWAQVFIDHRVPAVGYVVEDSLSGSPALQVLRFDQRGHRRPVIWVPIANVRSIETLHWSQVVNMCGKVEVSLEQILEAVSALMGVTVHAMQGSSKKARISSARMAAMTLATRLTSLTQQAISSRFGRRDHGLSLIHI